MDTNPLKTCNRCGTEKLTELFRVGRNICRQCDSEAYKLWAKTKGLKKVQNCNNRYYHNNKTTAEYKYLRYKTGSKQRGIEMNLTLDEFKQFYQKPCVYCGEVTKVMGLDRINSNLGYTIDNICSCCKRCNMAKNDMTIDEFIGLCRKIIKHHDIDTTTKGNC